MLIVAIIWGHSRGNSRVGGAFTKNSSVETKTYVVTCRTVHTAEQMTVYCAKTHNAFPTLFNCVLIYFSLQFPRDWMAQWTGVRAG
jgi:hypothetical protein